jgi:hypothetical protein
MLSCPDENSTRKSSDSIVHLTIRPFDHSTIRSFSQIFMGGPLSNAHRPAIVPPSSSQPHAMAQAVKTIISARRSRVKGAATPGLRRPVNSSLQKEKPTPISPEHHHYSINISNTLSSVSHQSASHPRPGNQVDHF